MDFLIEQAKTASPFVALFCLGVAALLWRQHLKDIRALAASDRAMMAMARAVEKLADRFESVMRQISRRSGRR